MLKQLFRILAELRILEKTHVAATGSLTLVTDQLQFGNICLTLISSLPLCFLEVCHQDLQD